MDLCGVISYLVSVLCTLICHCIFSLGGVGYNAQLKVNSYYINLLYVNFSKSLMLKLPFCLFVFFVRSHHLKGRGLLSPYQSQHLLKLHLVLHPALLCQLPLMQQDLLLLFHPLRESGKLEWLSSQCRLLKVCLLVSYALCMAIVIDYTSYKRRQ